MVDHIHQQPTPPGGAIGRVVQPELPPNADAFAGRAIQRLYLRRWLLMLCVCVTLIFVGVYKLPTVPAFFGVLSIMAGGAFIPREGVSRPLALNLRTSSRQLASEAFTGVLEGLPSPVILLDAQRRILHYNSLATDLWPALRPGDHISSYIRDPGVLAAVTNAHSGMRARQMVPYDQRVPIERHLEARISWIGRPANVQDVVPTPAIMIHLRDLTERERIDRLRTDFVTNASHELRTPLSALIGFIETLQGAARHDDAARDHFLDIMARQARRMARLIDNLLSLSRIEMRLHLRPDTPVNLVEIAEQVLTDLEPLGGHSGVHFHFAPPPEPAWVLGDRDELIQVVSNLVENAIKYGEGGGNVWLSIARERHGGGARFLFSVRDDGPGIDEEHLPRLTERFYRAGQNGGERSGTGLGLAIVKHVVTRHRGELRIASKVGEGSEFTLILGEAPGV